MAIEELCGNCCTAVFDGILCDSCNVWYHFVCSRVCADDVPVGDWFCKLCMKDREVNDLKCVIDLLQEDVRSLKEKLNVTSFSKVESFSEVVQRPKGRPSSSNVSPLQKTYSPVATNNRFSVLDGLEEVESPAEPTVAPRQAKKEHRPSSNNKKKILVLGSSHARHMGTTLQDAVGENFKVECICKPNAELRDVISGIKELSKGFSKDDHIVIVGGGGNSLDRDPSFDIEQDLRSISSSSSHTNINFVELFHRYDKPSLRDKVKAVNDKLWNFSANNGNINVLSVNSIRREEYTRHGLHLNSRGKKTLAKLIAEEFNCNRPIPVIVGGSSRFLGRF